MVPLRIHTDFKITVSKYILLLQRNTGSVPMQFSKMEGLLRENTAMFLLGHYKSTLLTIVR